MSEKLEIKYLDEKVIDQMATSNAARAARIKARISLAEIAKGMGLSISQVSFLENNKRNWTAESFASYSAAIQKIKSKSHGAGLVAENG